MNGYVAAFLLGAVVSARLLWRFAKAVERYRRGRVDLRNYINGIRGQFEVVRTNFFVMAKLGGVTLLGVIAVAYVLYQVAKGGK